MACVYCKPIYTDTTRSRSSHLTITILPTQYSLCFSCRQGPEDRRRLRVNWRQVLIPGCHLNSPASLRFETYVCHARVIHGTTRYADSILVLTYVSGDKGEAGLLISLATQIPYRKTSARSSASSVKYCLGMRRVLCGTLVSCSPGWRSCCVSFAHTGVRMRAWRTLRTRYRLL